MELLLVAHDAQLAQAIRDAMGGNGAVVHWANGGAEVGAALRGHACNCAVLDLALPSADIELALQRVREAGFDLPILVLTQQDQVQDRIRLLDRGVDDFLVKPVHLDELAARLRGLLRRRQQPAGRSELRHGRLCVLADSHTVSHDGHFVPLTDKEYWVLETLLRSKGRVLTRDQIESALYGRLGDVDSNAVEVHVHHLRRKLGADLIKTVRGIGYTLGQEP